MVGVVKKYAYNDVAGQHFPDANVGDNAYYAIDLTCLKANEGETVESVVWMLPDGTSGTDTSINSDGTEAHIKINTPKAGIYQLKADVVSTDLGKTSSNRLSIMIRVI